MSKENYGNGNSNDLLGIYLGEAMQTPLLSQEQEIELAKRIERGRDPGKYGIDPNSEDAQAAVEDAKVAKEAFALANTRLVVSIARKYPRQNLGLLDLIQEGNIGLLKAIEKFDYTQNVRFSTYAFYWIKQAIIRSSDTTSRTIRLPSQIISKIRSISEAHKALMQELGREPTTTEVSIKTKLSEKEISNLKRVNLPVFELDRPLRDKNGNWVSDLIADESALDLEQNAHIQLTLEVINEYLSMLSKRTADVLKLRYGLGYEKSHTLEEIGTILGLTRERVRQIEVEGTRKFRSLAQKYLDHDSLDY